MRRYITIEEFHSLKLYEVDNSVYNAIEREFVKTIGSERVAKKILAKHLEDKLETLTAQSIVDIMSCFKII